MKDRNALGQALVEFSLAITIFLVLLMGIVDFGMSIYKYNGVSQAAREIARVASVHQTGGPGTTFGNSTELTAVIATQKELVPGLGSPTYQCVDVAGAAVALDGGKCPQDAYVRVDVTAPYRAATPLVGVIGTITLKGSSSAQIQQ
jgi:Flp pilus assembly protein TadG